MNVLFAGEDSSISELLRRVAGAMGRASWLVSVPVSVLQLGISLTARNTLFQHLRGSLPLGMRETCELLVWQFPVWVDAGLTQEVRYYQGDC